jgi:hypothetical protein
MDERVTQRWSDSELLTWLSDGQRAIAAISPSLVEQTVVQGLVVGTKQEVPDGAFMLLDVKRNMGEDGATPGRTVTVVTRALLDAFDPNWHASARSSVTKHFIYDPEIPKVYYCWPPSTGTGNLEVSCAFTPVDLTTLDELIVVDDLYETALFDYVMFRAHQKDSDYSAGETKAGIYLQLFQNFMGIRESGKLTESPNMALPGTDLTTKGAAK